MRRNDKAIVFCGKKTRADDLSSDLSIEGVMCQCIHGDRDQVCCNFISIPYSACNSYSHSQSDRNQAIADISSGDVKILIATDVASRGLDIEDITFVILLNLIIYLLIYYNPL